MTYDVGKPDPGMGQAQQCSGVKPINSLLLIFRSTNTSHNKPMSYKFKMAISLQSIDMSTNQILVEHPKINHSRVQLQRPLFVIFNIHQLGDKFGKKSIFNPGLLLLPLISIINSWKTIVTVYFVLLKLCISSRLTPH
jgi:hypothetical protein